MELREIVPRGRSFDEYRRMFGLRGADLAGRPPGCGDGPASFNAEAMAVRVFPLVALDRRRSPYVEPVRSAPGEAGHTIEAVAVEYEFRRAEGHRGARMMRIRRRTSDATDPAEPGVNLPSSSSSAAACWSPPAT